jgi:hypothetical protein
MAFFQGFFVAHTGKEKKRKEIIAQGLLLDCGLKPR